jgi:osmotically inducible protein OsmC
MPTRTANATWEGGLKTGNGRFQTASGLGAGYSFGSRFEEAGASNPEELLAAAHAACYSMALSVGLERAGKAPQSVRTDAACTIEKGDSGFKITTMRLVCRAKVDDLDDAAFQQIAQQTKEGCPVSGALKALNIELDAKLER